MRQGKPLRTADDVPSPWRPQTSPGPTDVPLGPDSQPDSDTHAFWLDCASSLLPCYAKLTVMSPTT